MKPYKLNMTRPEFLCVCADRDSDNITMKDLQKLLPASRDLIYCIYTVLMDSNISSSDIISVDMDNENGAVIQFYHKSVAKKVKENFSKKKIIIGDKEYKASVKHKSNCVFVAVELMNPEVLDQPIIEFDVIMKMAE